MYVPGWETILLMWLQAGRSMRAPLDHLSGRWLLPYSRRYRGTIAVSQFIPVGVLLIGIEGCDDPTALAIYFLVVSPVVSLFFYAFYDAFLVTIGFSDSGLFLGRHAAVYIPWITVTKVRHVAWVDWFTFLAPGQPRVRISAYRDGLMTFFDVAGRGLKDSPAGGLPAKFLEVCALK